MSCQVSGYTHTAASVDCRLSSRYSRADGVSVRGGSWLAANCLLLPGVTAGENCLIAAGPVVTKGTEADAIFAGYPARKVRSIPQKEVAS